MDSSYIALGAVLISALSLAAQMLGKSLSIREHEEFRNNVKDSLREIKSDYIRDDARLEERVKILEQTRPTTGEIEARLDRTK
jgi:hypothetical protein